MQNDRGAFAWGIQSRDLSNCGLYAIINGTSDPMRIRMLEMAKSVSVAGLVCLEDRSLFCFVHATAMTTLINNKIEIDQGWSPSDSH